MSSLRKTSLAAGVCYLVTFASIPTLGLYSSVRERDFILGTGSDTPVVVGALLEMLVALAGIGTAVALYPVVKRQNQGTALGFVAIRVLEAAMIAAGAVALMAVVTLRQSGVGTDGLVTGQALVAVYDRSFLLGQSLMPAMNALLLGSLMYQSRLVPRILPMIGLIGAPFLIAATVATMFDVIGQRSGWALVAAIPIALWEFSLGIWLVVKGFRQVPITAS
jgi:hypothetical protein